MYNILVCVTTLREVNQTKKKNKNISECKLIGHKIGRDLKKYLNKIKYVTACYLGKMPFFAFPRERFNWKLHR